MKLSLRSFFILTFGLACFATSLQAAQYDIKEMTPRVQEAIDGRKNRYSELQSLKASGAVKENDQGYVTLVSASENAATIVAEENKDRRAIYETIVQQNNLGPNGMSVVEKAFAEVRRDRG